MRKIWSREGKKNTKYQHLHNNNLKNKKKENTHILATERLIPTLNHN